MIYALLTVSEEVVEVAEETHADKFNAFLQSLPASTIRVALLAILVLGICIYFILKPTEARKNTAKKYLNDLATNIMSIVLANIDFKVDSFTGKIETNFDDFKDSLVQEIYAESWNFVETAIKQEVKDGNLDPIASKYIKKESVESLVDLVMGRDDIIQKLKSAYNHLSNEVIQSILLEEAKAKEAAEEAEKQEEEPSTPVEEESVEAFSSSETPTEDSIELYEPVAMANLADEMISEINENSVG